RLQVTVYSVAGHVIWAYHPSEDDHALNKKFRSSYRLMLHNGHYQELTNNTNSLDQLAVGWGKYRLERGEVGRETHYNITRRNRHYLRHFIRDKDELLDFMEESSWNEDNQGRTVAIHFNGAVSDLFDWFVAEKRVEPMPKGDDSGLTGLRITCNNVTF